MKVLKDLGFILLAVYLILLGFVGLTGVGIPAVIFNLLALLAGIFLLFWIGKCCCCQTCHEKCDVKKDDVVVKRDRDF